MDSVLITMLVTAIYNGIAPFLLEIGKRSNNFPFMEPMKGVRNNLTSLMVAAAGALGINYTLDLHAHTFMFQWPDTDVMVKSAIGAGVGYLLQKFFYQRAKKAGVF